MRTPSPQDIRESHGQETTTISPLRRHSTQGGVTSSASLLQDATVLATQAMEAERQQQDLLRALYSDLVSAQVCCCCCGIRVPQIIKPP